MWWLIPIGIGFGIKLIYDAVTAEERESRERWESKRVEVEKTIEYHRNNIEAHINEAQSSYDYYFLIDLHFSSMKVADSAYQLLNDAKNSFSGINKMLLESKLQKVELEKALVVAKGEKNRAAINDIYEQFKMINELRKSVFDDKERIKQQKDSFLSEVNRLNNQTKQLKDFIRDRCGCKGKEWYNRLEERRRSRQQFN